MTVTGRSRIIDQLRATEPMHLPYFDQFTTHAVQVNGASPLLVLWGERNVIWNRFDMLGV